VVLKGPCVVSEQISLYAARGGVLTESVLSLRDRVKLNPLRTRVGISTPADRQQARKYAKVRTTFAATPATAHHLGRAAMNLIFSHIHPIKSQKVLGAYGCIYLSSDGMREDQKKSLLAAYKHHQWAIDGQQYFRVDCTDRVSIHFERAQERSSRYGPFERFSAINGLAYGDDKVVAIMDIKVSEWLYYDSGHHWPVLVVTELDSKR
jgi:hypothetical protein